MFIRNIYRLITAALLVALLVPLFPASAQESSAETISQDAFYNSADDYHVIIPPGWDNQSTADYAHFVQPDTQVSLYADAVETTDVQAGIAQALALLPEADRQPVATSSIILPNGTWTQNIYAPDDGAGLTAYGQVYESMTYVVFWYSPDLAAQPVVVPATDVEEAVTAALGLLQQPAGEVTPADTLAIGSQTWTRVSIAPASDDTAPAAEPLTALAYPREEFTQVIVRAGAPDADVNDAALPIFFGVLSDFFITPATTPYFYLGLGATILILLVFIGMMIVKYRNLRSDLKTLETLAAEGQSGAA